MARIKIRTYSRDDVVCVVNGRKNKTPIYHENRFVASLYVNESNMTANLLLRTYEIDSYVTELIADIFIDFLSDNPDYSPNLVVYYPHRDTITRKELYKLENLRISDSSYAHPHLLGKYVFILIGRKIHFVSAAQRNNLSANNINFIGLCDYSLPYSAQGGHETIRIASGLNYIQHAVLYYDDDSDFSNATIPLTSYGSSLYIINKCVETVTLPKIALKGNNYVTVQMTNPYHILNPAIATIHSPVSYDLSQTVFPDDDDYVLFLNHDLSLNGFLKMLNTLDGKIMLSAYMFVKFLNGDAVRNMAVDEAKLILTKNVL